ncbi:MAG: VWA domain-containing protein [Acidobacteriota bacterium]|nr:VWA domain-containing protein [Acidobacteriota bacterium]
MKTSSAGPGALAVGAVLIAACFSIAPPLFSQNPAVIRVRTDLVNIYASVLDANGQPVVDLTKDDFQLSENGTPQSVARFEAQTARPVDLALMIDTSSSEYGDLRIEAQAADQFIGEVVRPGDSLGFFEFDEDVTQIGTFTDDVKLLQTDVRRMQPGAGTSLFDAVVLGSKALARRPEDRRRAIIIVTDAGETTSVSNFENARRTAIASGALLYSIIVNAVQNENGRNTGGEHALITITDSTGGALFLLHDVRQIPEMFHRIDRELRTQYLIGYYPHPDPPPGSDRHVVLTVKGNYTVHYKKEYFAAAERE